MLMPVNRMMDPVHIWRDQYLSHNPVQPERQADVGVVKHGGAVEDNFKQDDADNGRADQVNQPDLEQHGKRDFNRVKPDRCGDIKIAVRVVDPVKPPEKRNLMRDQMLKPDGEIKDQDGDDDISPKWCRKLVQETPTLFAGILRGPNGQKGKEHCQQAQGDCVQYYNAPIGEPSGASGLCACFAGQPDLKRCEEGKEAKKDRQAYECFVFHEGNMRLNTEYRKQTC